MNKEQVSDKIVKVIENDISDRCGMGDEWGIIDSAIKKEIKATWKDLILKELAKLDDN